MAQVVQVRPARIEHFMSSIDHHGPTLASVKEIVKAL